MLTEDNERHTIGELRAEVSDRTYGLVHAREADIHHGTAFGFIVPHSGIKLAGDNEGRLCTRVPEAPGVLKDRLRRMVRRVCGACHDDT